MPLFNRNGTTETDIPECVEDRVWPILPDGGQGQIFLTMAQHPGTDWTRVTQLTLDEWFSAVRGKFGKTLHPISDGFLGAEMPEAHTVETDEEAQALALGDFLERLATEAAAQKLADGFSASMRAQYRCASCERHNAKQPRESRCPDCEAVRNEVMADHHAGLLRADGRTVKQFHLDELGISAGESDALPAGNGQ